MPIDYGSPPCPNTRPGSITDKFKGPCPRSDTYRAIENGNAHAVFGWLFKCRTCETFFFRAAREMGMAGIRAGEIDRLAKRAEQEERRR